MYAPAEQERAAPAVHYAVKHTIRNPETAVSSSTTLRDAVGALDCYTRRCCTLGGETFEVQADLVARFEETVGPAQDQVHLLIRRPGLVSPVN